jgi:pimeloyl-ACP methyl ester carboxylesterase
MSYVTVGRDSGNIDLYFEDHGVGKPVILIHGFPLSGRSWEKQIPALVQSGHRVITYDRRGFGKSSQPIEGYDYNTFAEDLRKLVKHLGLNDFDLVGFSMGTGEVARYLGGYGSKLVRKVVFIGSVPPFLLKSAENPAGLEDSVRVEIECAVTKDRLSFLTSFFENFYNVDTLLDTRITEEDLRYSWNTASGASPLGTLKCVATWWNDFRADVAKVDVPALIIHGDADRILPIDATGRRLHEAIKGSRFAVIEGAPHGLIWTHADKVNPMLVDFLK